MTDMTAPMAPERSASDPVWRILTGTALFGLGVFICGSVASYAPTDPSWNSATGTEPVNLFGSGGAVFADLARQCLGWSSWIAGVSLMIGGAMRAVLIGRPQRRRWLLGAAVLPLSAACFAAWPVPASWPLASGLGGLVGDSLFSLAVMPFKALLLPAPELLCGLVLGVLTFLCAVLALGFGRRDARALQLAASMSGRGAARKAGLASRRAATGFSGLLQRWRARRAERGMTDEDYMRHRARDHSDRLVLPEPESDEDDTVLEADGEEELDDLPALKTPAAAAMQPHTPKVRARRRAQRASTKLPPIDLLTEPPADGRDIDEEALIARAGQLGEVLKEFGVRGRIKEVRPGPVVTLFEMEPAPGVKSSRVISLADDIARSMSAASARVAVVPGKNAIGIELPNDGRETVYLRTLLESPAYQQTKAKLPMALGADIGGTPTVVELAKMPHLLIAGTTGSGKSVGVNAMILSLMYKLTPAQCRFIMIDPKMLELSIYEGIPHLLSPVVTDPTKAVNALKWTVREMEQRYELMSKAGVRNLAGFNEKAEKFRAANKPMTRQVQTGFDENGKPVHETEHLPTDHIPNIVVVIDEMADLMMVAGKEIEGCVQRLAQMARAAGIHLITATQRPSVDVITGTIKANFPTRISYMVTTKIDSRTILGEQGAEQLLGMGDLLYQAPGGKTKRCHGPFVSDEEVEAITDWLREQGEPDYVPEILEEPEDTSPVMDAMLGTAGGGGGEDDLYEQAKAVVIRDNRASTSYVQRRLKVGYNKAASLIERLEEDGVVSAPNHANKREVLMRADGASAH
ncbi:MAG: DNA translocase FtsK 4TM domain-containing protein [Hyphomonadaceae bacterium]|nr:DNA translocase FtsK 4TM domain-containing protein [Hyphomonadaceae bacterium]